MEDYVFVYVVFCSKGLTICTEATKRGMGAVLLRKPAKLARLVAGIAERSALPFTVKVRTGAKGVSETNLEEVSLLT